MKVPQNMDFKGLIGKICWNKDLAPQIQQVICLPSIVIPNEVRDLQCPPSIVIPNEVRDLQLAAKCRSLTSFGMTTPQGDLTRPQN
jgi:hypothetical protein